MPPAPLLIDAHVHFQTCFNRDAFLDAAVDNFARGAAELGLGDPVTGCLMFSETHAERWLLRWGRKEDGVRFGAWDFEPTGKGGASFVARRRADGERLLLIAGRQVRTREGLEVLALATTEEFPDGLPFHDALARVRWSGALTVIPWGFGKWSFYRGALVEEVVCRSERPGVCLGDNAGRPELGGIPRLFREAVAKGIPILPGSDPLPLPEQNRRAGSRGLLLEKGFDESRPAQSLRRTLRALETQPRTYGRGRELGGFLRDQLALRLGRRREPAPAPGLATAPSTWTR